MSNEKKDIFEKDFPKLVITEKTKENIKKYPRLYENCPVRVRMGRIYTNEEYEKYREETLKRPLPDDDSSKLIKKLINKKKR